MPNISTSSSLHPQEGQCQLGTELLSLGSRELGQNGHGRPGAIAIGEAHLRQFAQGCMGKVKLLACGSSHSIVSTDDNRIFAWGNGTSGQLGDGEKTVKDQPVEVTLPKQQDGAGCDLHVGGVTVVGVACGSRHSFVWTNTGQAYSFGNNFYAQLGYDFKRPDYKENQLTPHLFRNLPAPRLGVACVACGERHTVFALEDGRVAACGMNDYGQIGCDSSDGVVVPHFVERLSRVSKVTCGANHNLALTGEGELFQWGCGSACGNFSGNIPRPEEVMSSVSPVRDMAAGYSHCLLLTVSWGVLSVGFTKPTKPIFPSDGQQLAGALPVVIQGGKCR
ncbi:unnamed protein product [Lota lota]